MSAKRTLLIIPGLLLASLLGAQATFWSNSFLYHWRNLDRTALTGVEINKLASIPVGKALFEADNRFYYTDMVQDDRHERFTDRLQLSLKQSWQHLDGRMYYRGDYYHFNEATYFFPLLDSLYYNNPPVNRTFNQQIGIAATYSQAPVNVSFIARHRTLYYDPQGESGLILQHNNITEQMEARVDVIKPVTLFVQGAARSFLDDVSPYYDYSSVGAGVRMLANLSGTSHLYAQSRINWLKGDGFSIDRYFDEFGNEIVYQSTQRLIPVTSEIRYNMLYNAAFSGFISGTARNFYDTSAHEMLYNSSYLRAQLKYTFPYDVTNGSFVEVAGKYSPEDEAALRSSCAFIRSEMQVLPRLYAGGGVNYMWERTARYDALLRYFVSGWNEVYVMYNYTTDYVRKPLFARSYGAGLRLSF